jgi:hypothetical protein
VVTAGALRAGGSAEGARETLRLRVVVVSGDASAAFCDRVAGIVVVVVGGARGCWWWLWWERERVVLWMDSLKGMGEFVVTREGARAPIDIYCYYCSNKSLSGLCSARVAQGCGERPGQLLVIA